MQAKDNPILLSLILCSISLGSSVASGQSSSAKLRVGTYDSRAIAVAYARSPMMREEIARLTQEHDKAKAANDEKRIKELEADGSARQAQFHQQAFSTGSVVAILDKIKPELQAVALQAGVSVIVSKWEIVYDNRSVEYVDVTSLLVEKFSPTPEVLKIIEKLRRHDPIPQAKLQACAGD